MKILKISFYFILALFLCSAYGQQSGDTDSETLSLYDGTIDNQFEYVIRRSNRYQEYKVVKTDWLYTLKAHTMDSLQALETRLDSTLTVIESQNKTIGGLQSELDTTKSDLAQTNEEKDNISLLGIPMSKGLYKIVMWSIVAGLLVLLVAFIIKFKNSNAVTRATKKALQEMDEEFEEHRRTALEREQKVRRQLQDEINKQKS